MSRGGARFTHANLVLATLEHMALESDAALHELASGSISPDAARAKALALHAEYARLARKGIRHLRAGL